MRSTYRYGIWGWNKADDVNIWHFSSNLFGGLETAGVLDTYVYQVCFLADNEVQLIRNSRRRFLSFSKHASVILIEIENIISFRIKILLKKILSLKQKSQFQRLKIKSLAKLERKDQRFYLQLNHHFTWDGNFFQNLFLVLPASPVRELLYENLSRQNLLSVSAVKQNFIILLFFANLLKCLL